jgi:hypothetical protein
MKFSRSGYRCGAGWKAGWSLRLRCVPPPPISAKIFQINNLSGGFLHWPRAAIGAQWLPKSRFFCLYYTVPVKDDRGWNCMGGGVSLKCRVAHRQFLRYKW